MTKITILDEHLSKHWARFVAKVDCNELLQNIEANVDGADVRFFAGPADRRVLVKVCGIGSLVNGTLNNLTTLMICVQKKKCVVFD